MLPATGHLHVSACSAPLASINPCHYMCSQCTDTLHMVQHITSKPHLCAEVFLLKTWGQLSRHATSPVRLLLAPRTRDRPTRRQENSTVKYAVIAGHIANNHDGCIGKKSTILQSGPRPRTGRLYSRRLTPPRTSVGPIYRESETSVKWDACTEPKYDADPATVCTPWGHLAKDTEVSGSIPPDNNAASFSRL